MFRCCLYAVFALWLGGCGDSGEPLARLAPDAIILAFGDSLTFGTGAPKGAGYPEVLAELTGRKVINAGVPGEVTADGLKRLPQVLERTSPNLVVLCHGGNDMLRKRSLTQAEANLREMVQLVRSSGAAVVMMGVPKPGLFLSTADFYQKIADDMRVAIEDDIIPDLIGDNKYKSDPIHPNADGYRRIAQALQALLRDRGAL